jgi:precorrin-3B synthase
MGDAAQFDCRRIAGSVMSRFTIKGWCPSAYRPMLSGDGLVVRIRPRCGRFSAAQARGIADLAARYGNGLIDVTGRANLQIRGVRAAGHEPLLGGLAQLGLIDADEETEARRNVLVAPFWNQGDDTHLLATGLEQALAASRLGVPAKFGFALDCGPQRLLTRAPADVRIECGVAGGLIVRADGAEQGRPVGPDEAVDAALSLAKWFGASGGMRGGRGRMAPHLASGTRLPDALAGNTSPAPVMATPDPGLDSRGALVGLVFGQMESVTLRFLAGLAPGLRLTPWRMVFIEGLTKMPQHDGLVTRADDPTLRVSACTGAPACPQAHADTRALAAALASHLPADRRLHVSGCAKGCAHPSASSITLVGTEDGFDLIRDGCTRDAAAARRLDPASLLADPAALLGVG